VKGSVRVPICGRRTTLHAPFALLPSKKDKPLKPPKKSLKLEWVYGYRWLP
jgi:hypothetical protein